MSYSPEQLRLGMNINLSLNAKPWQYSSLHVDETESPVFVDGRSCSKYWPPDFNHNVKNEAITFSFIDLYVHCISKQYVWVFVTSS